MSTSVTLFVLGSNHQDTRSGTRQEELLYEKATYPRIVTIRRAIDAADSDSRTEDFINSLKKSATNDEFLEGLGKG